MKTRNLLIIILILLLADLVYSFFQHLHMPLDGDMAGIILPSEAYTPVMKDPLGMGVLLHDRTYAAPNRFFAHATMMGYFKTVPFFLQHFTSPLNSIYLASALAKTLVQLFILWLLAGYVSGVRRIKSMAFLLSALMVAPLFQTDGYHDLMGIIDQSVTYTFFYALPFGMLLLFFLPFYRRYVLKWEGPWTWKTHIPLLLLIIYLSFNTPIIQGTVLLLCPAVLIYLFIKYYLSRPEKSLSGKISRSVRHIPFNIRFYFTFFTIICFYSLLIGFNNAENPIQAPPLSER